MIIMLHEMIKTQFNLRPPDRSLINYPVMQFTTLMLNVSMPTEGDS